MANPSNMAKHWAGGLPPALIQRMICLLEMDKEAVLRQGWVRPSIEGPAVDRGVDHRRDTGQSPVQPSKNLPWPEDLRTLRRTFYDRSERGSIPPLPVAKVMVV